MDFSPLIGSGLGLAGSIVGGLMSDAGNKKALKYQKYLNSHRIQMAVADANAAGIHPLAALGATWSGSPIMGGSALGDSIGGGMEALGRGVESLYAQDADVRERAKDRALQSSALSQQAKENAQLRADQQYERQRQAVKDAADLDYTRALTAEARSRTIAAATRAGAIGGAGPTSSITRHSPAQTWENEYGDLVGNVAGIVHLGDDAGSALYKKYVRPRLFPTPDGSDYNIVLPSLGN